MTKRRTIAAVFAAALGMGASVAGAQQQTSQAELQKQNEAIARERKGQVGTGDRSEKIRTYNFPQSRVTDHRINFTTHQLQSVLDGNLDELIAALTTYYTAEKLREATQSPA